MTYQELLKLYKHNEFREIDKDLNQEKFYLLRSMSKRKTFNEFCKKNQLDKNITIDEVFSNESITVDVLIQYIRKNFQPKQNIEQIEEELNKMQYFDWGGSYGNNLEKNIVNNYIKKMLSYSEIENAITSSIKNSVYGYTMNSWYNHWSTIMLEEIFNQNDKIIPTIDLIKNIDFFIDTVPYDLKVTYFPEELMKEKISDKLKKLYGSKSELTCIKKVAQNNGISIPRDLKDRALIICLEKLLRESTLPEAQKYIGYISEIKNDVIDYYKKNVNELIIWLYEHQGEMRFDAANRFYVVLVDSNNFYDSWKLKRNKYLLESDINKKIDMFDKNKLNKIEFLWSTGKRYECYAELVFIVK